MSRFKKAKAGSRTNDDDGTENHDEPAPESPKPVKKNLASDDDQKMVKKEPPKPTKSTDDDEDTTVVVEGEKTKPSILDFNHDDMRKLNSDKLKEFDTNTLFKVLHVRGLDSQNPTLARITKFALLDLNFERRERPEPGTDKPNFGRNGFPNSNRGKGGFRNRFRDNDTGDDDGQRTFKPRNFDNDRFRPTGAGRGGGGRFSSNRVSRDD